MKLASRTLVLFGVLCSTTCGVAFKQESDDKPTGRQSQNTNFLVGLSGIQEWAAKLEQALRSQGKNIDKRKAKNQLLPKVISIQQSLSGLEDINRQIIEDAGAGPKELKRDKMVKDLNSLERKIADIEAAFSDLRDGVQVISLPEMTEVERLGESVLGERSMQAYRSLKILGYEANGTYAQRNAVIDYSSLKASSNKITELLHQAQDAFGKLHAYLEN